MTYQSLTDNELIAALEIAFSQPVKVIQRKILRNFKLNDERQLRTALYSLTQLSVAEVGSYVFNKEFICQFVSNQY